jgi:hypothetical protein
MVLLQVMHGLESVDIWQVKVEQDKIDPTCYELLDTTGELGAMHDFP